MSDREASRSVRARRLWRAGAGLHAALASALAAALVILVNLLAARFPVRWDASRTRGSVLSDKTRSLLARVEKPLRITLAASRAEEWHEDVRNLLRAYEAACPHIRVAYVDPGRELDDARELARRHSLTRGDVLALEMGERAAVVDVRQMLEYDSRPILQGRPRVRTAFWGEQLLSTAIQGLIQTRMPVVAFTTGQGEGDVEQFGPGGFSRIGMMTRRQAVRVAKVSPAEGIPEGCDVLVILGPTRPFSDSARAAVRGYLEKGGRVLALLERGAPTGLEDLLEGWGVRAGRERVAGPWQSGGELTMRRFADHPVTRGLSRMTVAFLEPRLVEPLADSSAVERFLVTPLVFGPDTGWVETDPAQSPPVFDPDLDRAGPASVAVAVERAAPAGIRPALPETRLVVAGDADFVSNGALSGGNGDFFLNALNWLLERDHLLEAPPRLPDEIRLDLTGVQRRRLFVAVAAGIPGFFLLAGLVLAWARRR